jgi:hypothetical protein
VHSKLEANVIQGELRHRSDGDNPYNRSFRILVVRREGFAPADAISERKTLRHKNGMILRIIWEDCAKWHTFSQNRFSGGLRLKGRLRLPPIG